MLGTVLFGVEVGLALSAAGILLARTILGVDYPEKRRRAILDAHERIHGRIAAKDPEGAAEAMRQHMDEFATYLHRFYPHVLEQPLRWDEVME